MQGLSEALLDKGCAGSYVDGHGHTMYFCFESNRKAAVFEKVKLCRRKLRASRRRRPVRYYSFCGCPNLKCRTTGGGKLLRGEPYIGLFYLVYNRVGLASPFCRLRAP